MLTVRTPDGLLVHASESEAEDCGQFTSADLDAALSYYEEKGYVVLRRLIPAELCVRARAAFDRKVRQSPMPMLRQNNMRYERNKFTAAGFLNNPIFNVQDLETRAFLEFKNASLDILTHRNSLAAISVLLRAGAVKLIQSMFFEAAMNTWAHQDSYYQDSARQLGGAVAGWYALEDIDVSAGRFYVFPVSHRALPTLLNHGPRAVSGGHDTYKRDVIANILEHPELEGRAPFLRSGDVLFWNSLTVHGSLPALRPDVSRASLTAHYLREADEMLQFHTRIRHQQQSFYNGVKVCLLHDQDKAWNQLMRQLSATFPAAWGAARATMLWLLQANRG